MPTGESMAKKRFRPRSANSRTGGRPGNRGGGNSGSSGPGPGGGKPRRRRRNDHNGPRRGPNPNQHDAAEDETIELTEGVGLLEMHPNGYGFLRSPDNNYSRERSDPFVPGTMIEKFSLREGVMIRGMVQPARKQQGPRLREILDVDGMPPKSTPTSRHSIPRRRSIRNLGCSWRPELNH